MDYTRTYDDMMVYPLLNTLQPLSAMAKPCPGAPFTMEKTMFQNPKPPTSCDE